MTWCWLIGHKWTHVHDGLIGKVYTCSRCLRRSTE